MKQLSNELKRGHYVFVRQDGHYGGNPEHSYIVFNVDVDVIAKLSGKFEQTSFFYCYPDGNGNIVNEYWEKKDTNAPYNSVKNPYVFINKTTKVNNEKDAEDFYSIIDHDYKYSIDASVFSKADDTIAEGINRVKTQFNLINESNDYILEIVYNIINHFLWRTKTSFFHSFLITLIHFIMPTKFLFITFNFHIGFQCLKSGKSI